MTRQIRPAIPQKKYAAGAIFPADLAAACVQLGWIPLQVCRLAGDTAYLVQDSSGIIEPYTRRGILDSAAIAAAEEVAA